MVIGTDRYDVCHGQGADLASRYRHDMMRLDIGVAIGLAETDRIPAERGTN